ncbi:Six-hairpin glycosidase-like protein [Lactarius indigo]|nr:Six-hairpin glycosidase-like protein [Lactarius indigo]
MRLLAFLLTTAALAVECVASGPAGSKSPGNKNKNGQVLNYFGNLLPVANHTILHELGGPEIGAAPGVVLALLPDPKFPDLSMFWFRDAALIWHFWLNRLIVAGDNFFHPLVDDAVHAIIKTQHITNIAGNVLTGGLAEGVYDRHIQKVLRDEARIGSPGGDSAPLRASVLLKYVDWLTEPKQNNGTWAADVLWPAINLDLQWISLHWNESSYDVWLPPVWAGNYWTSYLQYRALKHGAYVGRKIGRGEDASDFEGRASLILDYLQERYRFKEGWMADTTVTDVATGGRSGIGATSLAMSVLNFDPTLGCDSATFQPCSERALAGWEFLVRLYREHFPVNHKIPKDQPILIGAFPEDQVLDGGPLYWVTYNSAEQLLDALITWDLIGKLRVTKRSHKFFQQFDEQIKIGTYRRNSKTYQRLTQAIRVWAENQILLVAKYTPSDYVLPWTMNKTTGEPYYGPRGLAHSFASAFTVYDAYNGLIPPSWAHGKHKYNHPGSNGNEYRAGEQYRMDF